MSQDERYIERDHQVPDVAAQRRRTKGGQLHNNPEEPAEEGQQITPLFEYVDDNRPGSNR